MPGYVLAATCTPSFSVGGDYYDWARTDYGTALGVADVMGKGSAAAIMGATVRAGLRTASELTERDRDGRYRLDQVMSGMARIVTGDLLRTNIFVTVFLAHLEETTGRVDFADAGHGFCLVVSPTAASAGSPVPTCRWESSRAAPGAREASRWPRPKRC